MSYRLVSHSKEDSCVLFIMALRLRTEAEWTTFIRSAGISDDAACTKYAKSFVDNGVGETSLPQL